MFDFDDRPPSEYHYQVPLQTPQKLEHTSPDYLWLEKYIPYSEAESNVHWFMRFK